MQIQHSQEKKPFKFAAWGSKILGIYFILYTLFYALLSIYSFLITPKSPIYTITYSLSGLDFTLKLIYKTGQSVDFSLTIGTVLWGFAFYACSFIFLSMDNIINELKANV